ncbi:MAG TPA: SAM-dependent methyltransferase [Actinocrinis sp.]
MEEPAVDLQLDRAHSARMYDYYLGGRTNFVADREAVGRVMALVPTVLVGARANREFMHRATRFLAQQGIRQFLDVGTGIPTRPNLHEVAQSVTPSARIVYVDNDPIVLAHAKALLQSRPEGRTAYVQADLNDPAAILGSPELHDAIDLGEPVALSLIAVLPFIVDQERATAITTALKDAMPPGSALVITHGTLDFSLNRDLHERASDIYRSAGTAVTGRTLAEVAAFFDGWELVEPGITATFRWRPDEDEDVYDITDNEAGAYGAVAFKR